MQNEKTLTHAQPPSSSNPSPCSQDDRASALAWTLWAVGVAAYVVAVLHRTSFGVAGLDAVRRFDASAGILASFTVLQLVVYAGLQVPVGLMLDRMGPRRMVAGGALLMAAGQALLASTTDIAAAVAARVLVGAGDAMTFISVLSLVTAWFPARRIPVVTQLTGLLGQIGQVLSAIPLAALLHGPGWSAAFGSAAGLGVLVGVLSLAVLRDAPPGRERAKAPGLTEVARNLRAAWRQPGTRLGMWTHFVSQFSATAFALMWGYPYLVSGHGMKPSAASTLLTVFVLATMVSGPYLGRLVARHPLRRSWLVLGIAALNAGAWAAVLAWPPPAPAWLLVLLVLCVALGGPGSMIGFDFARTFNPPDRQGTASGIVNMGGFFAALVTILLIGFVLDALSPGRDFTPEAFRVAWAVQLPIWLVGVAGVLRSRALARRRLAEEGVAVPRLRDAVRAAVRRPRRPARR
ncbi:UNVERIFIED_ORG: nitrate/nitrite transporter NarK [Actinomadura viridilutea]|uniref:MFS transporter n=1 Tax=Actinomadura rubrobrunea TaxID=115335 RepID=UPI000ACA7418|nr:MFS transporter [Actinomadura rubrobrunea]